MIIIGITGTLSAGKGTIVDYLIKKKGFKHFSARAFLIQELEKRGLPTERDHIQMMGDTLRRERSLGYVIEELLKQAKSYGGNSVIESIRNVGEIQVLRKYGKKSFFLFAVDADAKLRYERAVKRKSSTDNISFEKFLDQEQFESHPANPWNMDLPECIKKADHTFFNNGTKKELHKQIEKVLGYIKKNLSE